MRRPALVSFGSDRSGRLWGHAPNRVTRRMAPWLMVAAVGLLGWSAQVWWTSRETLVEMQSQTAQSASAKAPSERRVTGVTDELTRADRHSFNRLISQLNTPWTDILETLENKSSADVVVLGVESDAERGTVRVQTQGRTVGHLLRHAQEVQSAPVLGQARLLRIESGAAVSSASANVLPQLSFELMIIR